MKVSAFLESGYGKQFSVLLVHVLCACLPMETRRVLDPLKPELHSVGSSLCVLETKLSSPARAASAEKWLVILGHSGHFCTSRNPLPGRSVFQELQSSANKDQWFLSRPQPE